MKFIDAFNIVRGDQVALVGAGGKTSTMALLARELSMLNLNVIATTTTRIAQDELPLFARAINAPNGFPADTTLFQNAQPLFVYRTFDRDKVLGFAPNEIDVLAAHCDVVLVEGDGARRLMFKMPREHEPVIPVGVSVVIPVVSFNILGKALDSLSVFNAAGIIETFDYLPGERIRSSMIVDVMRDARGGLKNVPPNARVIPFLNGVPREGVGRARARFIAQQIMENPRVDRVIIGNTDDAADPVYEVVKRVGAIVLAAGMSSRMGTPKVLLEWKEGGTILDHIVCELKKAHVSEICVVTGNHADEVAAVAQKHGVRTVFNAAYATGEMLSSLKAGLQGLPNAVSAALVVLGDQPMLQAGLVKKVMRAYWQQHTYIVAPSFQQRRGHPILIDRVHWDELLNLPENAAPRDMINRHSSEITYVNAGDDSVLRDVDTPEQYNEERRRAAHQHST